MAILSLQGVAKQFASHRTVQWAVKDVSFDVQAGEFVALVGPSGCGKSTLLNLLIGLIRPSAGTILYKGQPCSGLNTRLGYVTQQTNLFPWRTLRRNVELPLEIRGVDPQARRRRSEAIIALAGLTGFEDHYPYELSGGMQQRANIIRTLICDPEVVLMDEPFGQLDALTRSQLQGHLLQLWETAKRTILFITHDLREAIVLADRVIVMTARPGRIKSDTRVEIPRPRDVFRVHEDERYKPIHDRLWSEVVAEVAHTPPQAAQRGERAGDSGTAGSGA